MLNCLVLSSLLCFQILLFSYPYNLLHFITCSYQVCVQRPRTLIITGLLISQTTVKECCAKATTLQERMMALQKEVATLRETNTSKQEVVERLQKQLQDQEKQMANKIYIVIMVFIIISCIIFIFLRNA